MSATSNGKTSQAIGLLRNRTLWAVLGLIGAAIMLYFVQFYYLQPAIESQSEQFVVRVIEHGRTYAKLDDSVGQAALAVRMSNEFAGVVRNLQNRSLAHDIVIHLVIALVVAAIVIGAISRSLARSR